MKFWKQFSDSFDENLGRIITTHSSDFFFGKSAVNVGENANFEEKAENT